MLLLFFGLSLFVVLCWYYCCGYAVMAGRAHWVAFEGCLSDCNRGHCVTVLMHGRIDGTIVLLLVATMQQLPMHVPEI